MLYFLRSVNRGRAQLLSWAIASLAIAPLSLRADTFLVASDYFGTLKKVDPSTGVVLGSLSGGSNSGELAFGSDGFIYASHFESSSIERINANTGASAGSITLPGKPRDIAFGPDGQLYIAVTGDGNGHGNIGIYQFNPITQQVSSPFNTFTMDGSPIGIAFGPGNELLVALDARYGGDGNASIVKIDGATGDSLGVFTSSHLSIPQSIAFGPNGDLYAGNQGTGAITEYGANGAYLATLTTAAGNPQGLYFMPDGGLIFGTGGSDFERLDVSSDALTTFSSGYGFASSAVLVPEPRSIWAMAAAVGVLASRRRRNSTCPPPELKSPAP